VKREKADWKRGDNQPQKGELWGIKWQFGDNPTLIIPPPCYILIRKNIIYNLFIMKMT